MEVKAETDGAGLSDGEIVSEEAADNGAVPEDATEPSAKRRRLSNEGGWELTKKQQKSRMRKQKKEKMAHQEIENKMSSSLMVGQRTDVHLNARQVDVVKFLVQMSSGELATKGMVQKLKTILFQNVVSHLVTGLPVLGTELRGGDELCSNHKVVVLWLSMISSDFFNKKQDHFKRVKKLTPCVTFDVEHPGSTRFVKLGLEGFMMLQNPPTDPASVPAPPPPSPKPRWTYLLSLTDLDDNGYPLKEGVDQTGRDIGCYVSIMEWPDCEVQESSQVSSAKEGVADMPMFAIDCEMVETQNGSELVRISIVNEDLECVYDTYVKPDCPVVDYRTKFSGVTESTLEGVTTTLQDVQEALPTHLPANSILIGHSLENDFHAMKFKHPFVIDTALAFTPLATPTGKPGLRRLCKELLDTDIQNTEKGHDSIEDATSCMKLMLLKLEKGDSCMISFNEITPSIFTSFRTQGHTTGIVDKDSVIRLFGKGSSFSAPVKTDEEAVSNSSEIISQSKFTFIQLHDMEYLLKTEEGKDREKVLETADTMDANVLEIVEKCPPQTIVFLVFGSGDIRKVRNIQQQEIPNFQDLKKQVMLARTGHVLGLITT